MKAEASGRVGDSDGGSGSDGAGGGDGGVSRRAKVAFAVLAALSLLGILGSKAYQVFVEPDALAIRYLGIEPLDAPAPAFELKTRDGRSRSLADFKGRFVLLNFWATWCDSCRVEMPSMAALAARLKGEPLTVVAASVDEGWEPIDRMLGKEESLPFQVLLDPESAAARAFGTTKFPETWLIGPDGRMRARFVGPRDWADRAFEVYFRRQASELAQAPGASPPRSQK